jgi:threonine/homoserine/homoserine lactone efflux protein
VVAPPVYGRQWGFSAEIWASHSRIACAGNRVAHLAKHSGVFRAEVCGGCVSHLPWNHERSLGQQRLDARDVHDRQLTRSWFGQGFVNNLLNPKVQRSVYLGVFTTVITPDTSPGAMFLLIVTMMLVSALSGSASSTPWIGGLPDVVERSQQKVNRLLGALLILLGLRVRVNVAINA